MPGRNRISPHKSGETRDFAGQHFGAPAAQRTGLNKTRLAPRLGVLNLGEILADKNAPYLFVAYGVFLGALLVYFLSLGLRRRSMEQDERIVEQIEAESAKSGTDGQK
jgi:hypothetical protein